MLKDKKYKGFSLIEILIVVGLILILAAVTIVAINPAKHFRDTRDSERSADVGELLNAVTQYTAEEGNLLSQLGEVPACLENPTDPEDYGTEIGKATGNIDLAGDTSTDKLVEEYIVEIPVDPSEGDEDGDNTGYYICETAGGRVQISAPHTEEADPIVVRR